MKVLIGCEFSGIVRDAFLRKGHDAISCDILPTERPGPHIQDDVLKHVSNFDLGIFFPPCTYLTVSGNRWIVERNLYEEQKKAVEFVKKLWNAPIKKIAIENPVGRLSTLFMKPSQIINPWEYGHGERKRTCLWEKNLPLLKPTKIVPRRVERVFRHVGPGPDRMKNRSRTYPGIAEAMATQWN